MSRTLWRMRQIYGFCNRVIPQREFLVTSRLLTCHKKQRYMCIFTYVTKNPWHQNNCRSTPVQPCLIYGLSDQTDIMELELRVIFFWTSTLIASSWDQHGAHLGPKGPRWAPCWPHEPCYLGRCAFQQADVKQTNPQTDSLQHEDWIISGWWTITCASQSTMGLI